MWASVHVCVWDLPGLVCGGCFLPFPDISLTYKGLYVGPPGPCMWDLPGLVCGGCVLLVCVCFACAFACGFGMCLVLLWECFVVVVMWYRRSSCRGSRCWDTGTHHTQTPMPTISQHREPRYPNTGSPGIPTRAPPVSALESFKFHPNTGVPGIATPGAPVSQHRHPPVSQHGGSRYPNAGAIILFTSSGTRAQAG